MTFYVHHLVRFLPVLVAGIVLPWVGYCAASRVNLSFQEPTWISRMGSEFWGTYRAEKRSVPPMVAVEQRTFFNRVGGRGSVESTNNTDILCDVDGYSTLTYVIPEGTYVNEGDLLARIDSKEQYEIYTRRLSEVLNTERQLIQWDARLYNAVISLDEYVNGTFEQEWIKVENKLYDNQQSLRTADDLLRHTRRLIALGFTTHFQLDSNEYSLQNAKNSVQKSTLDQRVLLKHASEGKIANLVADIDLSRMVLDFYQKYLEFRRSMFTISEKQYNNCSIYAPCDGEVVHASQMMQSRGSESYIIREGSAVTSGQLLFRIPDTSNIQIRTLINESDISKLRPGQPAFVSFGVNSELRFQGEVVRINPFPEYIWRSSAKNYLVNVRVNDPDLVRQQGIDLRTGMSADVEIATERLDNVLVVPIHCIIYWQDKAYCLTWEQNAWKYLPVTLGPCDDEYVVIREGLTPKDQVATFVNQYLSEIVLPGMANDASFLQQDSRDRINTIADEMVASNLENSGSQMDDTAQPEKDPSQNSEEQENETKKKEKGKTVREELDEVQKQQQELHAPLAPYFVHSTMEMALLLDANLDKKITREEVEAVAPQLLPFYEQWDRDRCGVWSLGDFVYGFYRARVAVRDDFNAQ